MHDYRNGYLIGYRQQLCSPSLRFILSFLPVFCAEQKILPASLPGVYTYDSKAGYSVQLGTAGIDAGFNFFSWMQGYTGVHASGRIELGSQGVYPSKLLTGSAYSYEIILFIAAFLLTLSLCTS